VLGDWSQTCKLYLIDSIREIKYSDLLEKAPNFANKVLMSRIRLDVVVSIFCGVEDNHKAMCKAVLQSGQSWTRLQKFVSYLWTYLHSFWRIILAAYK